MSCMAADPTFRLLDPRVGWDAADYRFEQIAIGDDGLRLALLDPDALDAALVDRYLPDPRLAFGCSPCDIYLAAGRRMLRWDTRADGWTPAPRIAAESGSRVAMTRDWIAVTRPRSRSVMVYARPTDSVVNRIKLVDAGDAQVCDDASPQGCLPRDEVADKPNRLRHVGPIAIAPEHQLFVALNDGDQWGVARFDVFSGDITGVYAFAGDTGRPVRIGVSADRRLWVVSARLHLFVLDLAATDSEFRRATTAEFAAAFPARNLLFTDAKHGFCLSTPWRRCEGGERRCFDWHGRPAEIDAPPPPTRFAQGQVLTAAIDSGLPHCRWHRVRLDALMPAGTTVAMAVATSDDPAPPPQGDSASDLAWSSFVAGVPYVDDWQLLPDASSDALIDQPAGRYLFLRLRLKSDRPGITPTVRQIRLDFPRSTSAALLPAVYRTGDATEDFTERFLSLFDASLEDVDRTIEAYASLLDADGVNEQVLSWLASMVDLTFDPAWDTARRRAVLRALPELYRLRGTPAGLKLALRLAFDVDDARIVEGVAGGSFGAIGSRCRNGDFRLGVTRLFGSSRVRFRLGGSTLGSSPLKRFGDPDRDALIAEAFRFSVVLADAPALRGETALAKVRALIDALKPAHTVASLRVTRRGGWRLGIHSDVGIDTVFLAAEPVGLGAGLALRRNSILAASPERPRYRSIDLAAGGLGGPRSVVR